MKTRAAVYAELFKPLVVEEIELPDPGPNQVMVKQFATGVCHSQLHQLHRPTMLVPTVIGHESTGVVTAVGSRVTYVKEGDHVMTTWLPRDGHPTPSDGFEGVRFRGEPTKITGEFRWAEDILIDQHLVVKMDASVPTDVTSIIGCAVMTGCGAAMNTAGVRPGNSVAVFGVGGVGLCVVQACANLSADPVIAVDLADEKLEFARKFGATMGINASKEDAVAKILDMTGGVDVAFDAIGARATMEQIIRAVRSGNFPLGAQDGGTAVIVGVPTTEATLAMPEFFRGNKTCRGTVGGSSVPERDFPLYLRWYKQGKLPLDLLVTRRYKLDEINEACAALEAGQIAGRAIVQF